MAAGLFRVTAGVCRTMIIANTGGALTLLLVFLLGGFILPRSKCKNINIPREILDFSLVSITDKVLSYL